ncbi:MAG: hypothetical protein A07HB70_01441 [uncultured archaeon A07HB70]|nr:MAG: hypothetical protein A07HB70_01441 [uncultured archaeon A07HB70]
MSHGDDPRVAARCGSLRDDTRTRVALEAVLVASGDAGVADYPAQTGRTAASCIDGPTDG